MKLAIGTAQFGLNYGISNTDGQVTTQEISNILYLAQQSGITTLDTASVYGESEEILGNLAASQPFNIVTKIPNLNHSNLTVCAYIKQSLKRLQREQLDAVMFHDVNNVITAPNGNIIFNELSTLKNMYHIKKIGVSVYTPAQAQQALAALPINIIQVPLNCLDQRFIVSGCIKQLASKNIEIHCRSIFLQGLLLMQDRQLADYFIPYKAYIERFWAMAKKLNLSELALALSIAKYNKAVDKIVVGCCSKKQLEQILNAYQESDSQTDNLLELACSDEKLIIPSNWRVKV